MEWELCLELAPEMVPSNQLPWVRPIADEMTTLVRKAELSNSQSHVGFTRRHKDRHMYVKLWW